STRPHRRRRHAGEARSATALECAAREVRKKSECLRWKAIGGFKGAYGLKASLDDWPNENKYVKDLKKYASYVSVDLLNDYVWALTHTYVGYTGSSMQYSRSDFYANAAAPNIQDMFALFDDNSATAFIETIKTSKTLKSRINSPTKLNRLRTLANIILEKTSSSFSENELLEVLVDETKEKEFLSKIR
ncbi:MAG: hypothetical protein GY820_02180, partial [Gammaproteobacteria bacterium]|nr:hypothetical protein [Gammaproteobacteria bacterium]